MRGKHFRLVFLLVVAIGCCLSSPSYSQDQSLLSRADSLYERGIELSFEGQYQDALLLFDEVSDIRDALLGKDHPDYARSLNKIGNCYADLGDNDKALEFYTQALNIIEKALGKESQDYAGILNNIGNSFSDLGDYNKALEYLNESLAIREKVHGKRHPYYAQSLLNIGGCYSILGDDIKALECFFQALDINEKAYGKDHPECATCLSNIGYCYIYLGDYNKGLEYCQKALLIRKKVFGTEHPDYANSLSYIGICYYELGDYYKALDNELQALDIYEKALGKEHPLCAENLNYIGLCYFCLNDFDKALEYNERALAVQEMIFGKEHTDYATSLNNIGNVYSEIGDYTKALEYHLQALEIYEKIFGRDYPDLAENLEFIGFCYSNLNEYDKALEYQNEALAIREKILGKEHPSYAASLVYIGMCLDDKGDYDKAIEYYSQALAIHERVYGKESSVYATNLNNIGTSYWAKDDDAKALEYHKEALSIREKILGKDHPDYAQSLLNSGLCYYSLGDFPNASSCFSSYSSIAASIVTKTFSSLTESQRESFWKKNSGFFTDLLFNFCSDLSSPEMCRAAYDGALLGKGLLLNAETEMRKLILESGDEKALEMLNLLQESRIRLDQVYQDPSTEKATIDSLNNDIDKRQRSLIRRSKVYGDYTRNLALKWDDVQKSLGKKDIAIEFETYTDQDTTYYIALTIKKGYSEPHLIKLFSSEDIARIKPNRYYTSTAMTDLVWGELQDELEGTQNVYFSPVGELNNIGIEYLVDMDGKHLISQKRNYYRLTSTRELVKKNGDNMMRDAIVYGGIRYDITPKSHLTGTESDEEKKTMVAERISTTIDSLTATRGIKWDFLPGTKAEAEAISSTMTANSVKNELIEGEDGTEESFKALSGDNRDVIHIATHGFYWTDREASRHHDKGLSFILGSETAAPEEDRTMTRSGLLFAGAQNTFSGKEIPQDVEDGILTAKEIARLDLRGTNLVVISACQSGLGEVTGDGVLGLQRGFKKAGVQSLVMSLWEVNDEATRILMTRFYENLSKRKSKYVAFQDAQKYLRNYKDGIFDRPEYYAAFVLLDAIQ